MRTLSLFALCASFLFLASAAKADLPPGPGHDETVKVCGKCHSPEQAASLRQTRTGWEETISKMVNMGSEGTDQEYESILNYLTKTFGPEPPKPIEVNKPSAIELEAGLGLTRTESAALLKYRTDNGEFKTLEDIAKVPGIDFKKVKARKARLKF